MAAPIHIPTTLHEGSFFPHPLQHLLFVVFLIIVILTSLRWYLTVVFIWIFLMIRHVEHLFIWLFVCMSSLEKCLYRTSAHFFNWVVCFFDGELYKLYIFLDIKPLLNIVCKYLLPFSRRFFCIGSFFFHRTKAFILMWYQLFILSLYFYCLRSLIQKNIAKTDTKEYTTYDLCRNLMASGLPFKSLIHCEFVFV